MKKSNNGWLEIHRPVLIVMATIVAFVGLYAGFVAIQRKSLTVGVQVLEDKPLEATSWSDLGKKVQPVVVPNRGVYIEAERLRSATVLGMASLAVFMEENLQSYQRNQYAVFDGFSACAALERRGMLPPDVRWTRQGGWCESDVGKFEVRVRASPVLIEVWGQGKGGGSGQSLLIQLGTEEPRLWRAKEDAPYVGIGQLPAQLVASGWERDVFRKSPLDEGQMAEVQRWIESQK